MSFQYVALGDSLSVGVGASIFSPGFVQRYQRLATIELDDSVFNQTFAHPGYETKDVLLELNNPYVREQITNADIITITAGGNDLIEAARKFEEDHNEKDFSSALNGSMENFSKIMKEIKELKKGSVSPYIVRLLSLYNPFPNNPLAVKWISKFNAQLKNFMKKPSISVVNIENVFKGHETEYLSPDGVHPNDLGYSHIAEVLNRLGYGDLSSGIEEE